MKRAWKILTVCALIFGGVYACNEISYRNFSLRYRLTVSVDDNGQIKTGTSVIETRYESPAGIFCFPFCGRVFRFYGNAVTVDLGAKGLLFVIDLPSLIDRDIPGDAPARDSQVGNTLATLPITAYGYNVHVPELLRIREELDSLKKETRPATVPPLWMPMIVRFRDLDNPKSVEEVDPVDMVATLGRGVHLVDTSVQITDESITPKLSFWPKWLANGSQPEFPVHSSNGKLTYILAPPAFTRE